VNGNVILIHGELDSQSDSTDYICMHLDGDPLVDIHEIENLKHNVVTIRYWINNSPLTTVDQATEQTLMQTMGLLDPKINHAWSECTGYLWTEEHLKVGGHDILAEMWSLCKFDRRNYSDETKYFLLMEITVHEKSD
jgi:hypothetical protein